MNLLGFLSIVITVTGLVWLLQLLMKGKDRIDINLSVGRTGSAKIDTLSPKTIPQTSADTVENKVDDVLGNVILRPNFNENIDKINPKINPATNNALADLSSAKAPNPTPSINEEQDDDYIDRALLDETLEDYTSESLLKETSDGQLAPPLGHVSLNPFAIIANELPADSFDNPQVPEQIEAMFELLRENTRRIEQQMMALYTYQKASLKVSTHPSTSQSNTNQPNESTDAVEENSEGDYDFSDDDRESPFGGGLDKQLGRISGDDESETQTDPSVEYISAEELGGEMPEDACQSYDLDQIRETPEMDSENRVELLPYLASLNKTGELSHDVVNAIRQKESTKVVKHRVRQLLRAIDHYRLSGDSNAALRVTAVMSKLPTNLGKYANSIADVGRKFGLAEPEDSPAPVESEEISVG